VLSLLSGEITEGERELVKDPFLRRGGGLRGGICTLGAAPTNKRVVEHIESAYAHALPADTAVLFISAVDKPAITCSKRVSGVVFVMIIVEHTNARLLASSMAAWTAASQQVHHNSKRMLQRQEDYYSSANFAFELVSSHWCKCSTRRISEYFSFQREKSTMLTCDVCTGPGSALGSRAIRCLAWCLTCTNMC